MTTVKTQNTLKPKRILWLGDLHMDRASASEQKALISHIDRSQADRILISGDITTAPNHSKHLRMLSKAAGERHIYFVSGNHDYYGSSINVVDAQIDEICLRHKNLKRLSGQELIEVGANTCLIGHRGWADLRAGYGMRTVVDTPDRHAIKDFDGLSQGEANQMMKELGKESAKVFRQILPLALTEFRNVLVLTHVPVFRTAARYNHKLCGPTHQPHYTNVSAGLAIMGIARAYPRKRIMVLSGHTHTACHDQVLKNLSCHVGHARTGKPGVFGCLHVTAHGRICFDGRGY